MSAIAHRRRRIVAGLKPGITTGRLAAGAIGGVVGGLLFGALMFTSILNVTGNIPSPSLLPRVSQILHDIGGPIWAGTLVVWTAHMLMSIIFGVVFSLLVSPHSSRLSIVWGLVWGVVLWIGGAVLVLPALLHETFELEGPAFTLLLGHLLFGLGLGGVYAAFHRLEVIEMLDSPNERTRAWARRERDG